MTHIIRYHTSNMACYIYHICFLIICTSFFVQINSEKHVALFTFGDSLFARDTPIFIKPCYTDKSLFNQSTISCLEGCKISDFIAEYAGLPFIPPYWQAGNEDRFVEGTNFAQRGAGALFETNWNGNDLKTQLKQFQNVSKLLEHKLGKAEATKIISNAVYLFSIGTNDYARRHSVFANMTQKNYMSMVIGNVRDVVEGIYEEGGRKFAFMSLCPLGCLPFMRLNTGACNPDFNELAKQHNKALSKVLKDLLNSLSGFKYSVFDFFKSGWQMINHPSKYGFKNGGDCCWPTYRGDPCAYVFTNKHPSEKAGEQLAQLARNGKLRIATPYNFKKLFEL